jgi:hypothetical protein
MSGSPQLSARAVAATAICHAVDEDEIVLSEIAERLAAAHGWASDAGPEGAGYAARSVGRPEPASRRPVRG